MNTDDLRRFGAVTGPCCCRHRASQTVRPDDPVGFRIRQPAARMEPTR